MTYFHDNQYCIKIEAANNEKFSSSNFSEITSVFKYQTNVKVFKFFFADVKVDKRERNILIQVTLENFYAWNSDYP